jgi:hypothetical protein
MMQIIFLGLIALFFAFGLLLWRVSLLINQDLDREQDNINE